MPEPLDRKPHEPPGNGRLAADTPRKGAFPLIWLLVLAALLAFAWSLYNRHAGHAPPAAVPASTPRPASPPS